MQGDAILTYRNSALVGATIGFVVSACILTLLWYGVSGVLTVGDTHYMYVFWPSAAMLVLGWYNTFSGIMVTVFSVVINCLTYAAIGLLLRVAVGKLWGALR